MRYLAGSAAIIFAAAMSFNSAGESETCRRCSEIVTKSPNADAGDYIRVASLEQPEDTYVQAPAVQNNQTDDNAASASPPDLCTVLIEAARDNDLPPSFLLRLIWQESRFDPRSVSHAGARGIAQFMPETANEVGLSDPYNPREALPASGRLLNRLQREFGNLGLAAAAYNAGSGRIRRWLSKKESLPRETRNYIRIITGHEAETWTRESSLLSMQRELPRDIPCKDKDDVAADRSTSPVTVALTPEMIGRIRDARAQAEVPEPAAKRTSSRSRLRHGKGSVVASHRKSKLQIARASGKTKSRNVRLASAR